MLIIVISALALGGLLVSQLRWITNALTLSEEQYDHRVTLALNEVVDILSTSTESYRGCTNVECELYDPHMSQLEHVVNQHFLKATIQNVFRNYDLMDNYEYTLINIEEEDIENNAIYSNMIALKPHEECSTWKADDYQLGVYFPHKQQNLLSEMWFWLLLSGVLFVILAWLFYFIVFLLMQQKKVAEIKNDFINNMTHEFKTPLATISLATEVLMKSGPDAARERIKHYSRIIQEENNRMKIQVEYILKMALLQKSEINLKLIETDIHKLIREAVDTLCLEQYEKTVNIRYNFRADCPMAMVDEMHFYNIVTNMISNAAKYSGKSVDITIGTANLNGSLMITFQDNGVGIRKEHQPHIFEKFYRVPTGNIHDTKGFGLGLFYVKEMVTAHKGEIDVESEPGVGTSFHISLAASRDRSSPA